jgi:prevent-host-death family protein
MVMKEVAISEFKAKCLALLDQVQKTKKPILITRRGEPVAEIVPPTPIRSNDWIGSMKNEMDILGDLIAPASDEDDWEVLRD